MKYHLYYPVLPCFLISIYFSIFILFFLHFFFVFTTAYYNKQFIFIFVLNICVFLLNIVWYPMLLSVFLFIFVQLVNFFFQLWNSYGLILITSLLYYYFSFFLLQFKIVKKSLKFLEMFENFQFADKEKGNLVLIFAFWIKFKFLFIYFFLNIVWIILCLF